MRAPRRVPWASKSELTELYDFLFSPSADDKTLRRGLARMSVYIGSPSCPAFLPLLHDLLSASLRARESTATAIRAGGGGAVDKQAARLACAMALVRLVNGMVDPLQTGPYARPISHIAATLHIPPSLISIRHRATHEDLPPLHLLLTSTHQAIDYLHNYAFLPLLAESSTANVHVDVSVGPMGTDARAAAVLKRWKTVMKERVREKIVGHENETGRELRALRREMDELDVREAVSGLCAAGGLVPVARSKRPSLDSTGLSTSSTQVWDPLLTHLREVDPELDDLLADRIVATLISPIDDNQSSENGPLAQEITTDSYRWNLSLWLLQIWPQVTQRRQMWRSLLLSTMKGDRVVVRLIEELQNLDPSLRSTVPLGRIVAMMDDDDDDELSMEGVDGDAAAPDDLESQLDSMERRLQVLERQVRDLSHEGAGLALTLGQKRAISAADVPKESLHSTGELGLPGWRRLDRSDWRACPIGA